MAIADPHISKLKTNLKHKMLKFDVGSICHMLAKYLKMLL